MADKMMLKQVRDVLEYVRSTCFTLEDGSRVFCGDMADAIDAHLNAAKGEAVAWRYRFYGSQGWVYATAGEELVCGLPLIYSHPLYAHPASPDVVRDEALEAVRMTLEAALIAHPRAVPHLIGDAIEKLSAAMSAREGGE